MKEKEQSKLFYRITNPDTGDSLWYDRNGIFTDEIKQIKYAICKCQHYPMPFNPDVIGYFSCCDSIQGLFDYFSENGVLRLKNYGFRMCEYEAVDFKFNTNHWLMKIDTTKILRELT